MFKVVQGVLVAAGLGLAFGAGYELRPAKTPATPVETVAPVTALPDYAPAVDIRLPVGEMTPVAALPVDRNDVTYKWIEKELGIDTSPVSGAKGKPTPFLLQTDLGGAPASGGCREERMRDTGVTEGDES